MVEQAILARDGAPAESEEILLGLNDTARHNTKDGGRMTSALREILRRRRSRLSEPKVWRDLGLPEELVWLVETDRGN
jgi:hypothetical protein